MSPADELTQQAEQFRASGLLGKPGTLSRLFDFLLARSLEGGAPKETEIALQVFGKSPGFDVSQDAVVRVYVHKLRRRLEEFSGRTPGAAKIVIPKGEYRLLLERPAAEPVVAPTAATPPSRSPSRRASWIGIGIATCCALVVGALLGAGISMGGAQWDMREVRHSAVWAPLLEDDLPITIVIGDYYLLGEANPQTGHIDRLVREFFINSHEDFRDHAELNPQLMQRYRNLDLTYLPAASAFALQDIVPVLGTAKPVRVVLMSQLDANALKNSHIVYIGYISGLGMLGDRVFAASRVSPGGSYDELVDTKTDHTYLSTAMGASSGGEFRDYGYFSTFAGPNGNRVVVIAGTRDIGVMQMAQSVSLRHDVDELCRSAGKALAFESLVEISGMGQTGFKSRSVFVSGMKAEKIWESG
ncbi:MAG TPA: hypothetical protein VN705_20905 [Steroidobacteraceae bacterium]|nr:hypothetical protein [Steroidobacteraceae bacterium]